jgi:hypothetical protein
MIMLCCVGTLRDPISLEGKLRMDALGNRVGMAEGYRSKAKEVVSKASTVLTELYTHMFPKDKVPQTLEGLADVFRAEPSPLAEYSHTQTICGAQITLAMAATHGVPEVAL